MKKNTLYTGIAFLLVGLALFACAGIWELPGEALLWGFGGAGVGSGCVMVWKYFYWSRPHKAPQYAQRLESERIELGDERKIMLRDKSGRLTYQIMLGLFCLLAMLCSGLTVFNLFMPFARYLTIIFSLLLLLQFFCNLAVFRYLDNRL